MEPDSRRRFSAAAADYKKYRPTYPPELLDWLAGLVPACAVADVGCGTGILSRLLAARGYDVTGVDPNEQMLEHARADGGGPRYQRGEATATGLADESVGLVTVAQAFHWFDVPAAWSEFRRILTADGWCVAVWNDRDIVRNELLGAYERLLLKFSSEYADIPKADGTLDHLRALEHMRDWTEAEFTHTQTHDHDAFFGRVYSSSFVVHGVADTDGFDAELEALFAKHASGGEVTFDYVCRAYAWASA